jgi:hypothetical protein
VVAIVTSIIALLNIVVPSLLLIDVLLSRFDCSRKLLRTDPPFAGGRLTNPPIVGKCICILILEKSLLIVIFDQYL